MKLTDAEQEFIAEMSVSHNWEAGTISTRLFSRSIIAALLKKDGSKSSVTVAILNLHGPLPVAKP